nr:MAG TPA: HIRA B motif [Caudoviricetes sp.]
MDLLGSVVVISRGGYGKKRVQNMEVPSPSL